MVWNPWKIWKTWNPWSPWFLVNGTDSFHGYHRLHGSHRSMKTCGPCRRHGSLLMKQWKGASLVQEGFLQTSAGRSFKKCGLTKSITRCCFTDTHLGSKAVLSEHGPSSSVHINVRQHRPYVCVLVNKSDPGTWLEWFHKLLKP